MSIPAAVNSPAVKALVTDFILTLTVALSALAIAPASFQDLILVGDVVAFAAFKSAVQASVRGILKWSSSD